MIFSGRLVGWHLVFFGAEYSAMCLLSRHGILGPTAREVAVVGSCMCLFFFLVGLPTLSCVRLLPFLSQS